MTARNKLKETKNLKLTAIAAYVLLVLINVYSCYEIKSTINDQIINEIP